MEKSLHRAAFLPHSLVALATQCDFSVFSGDPPNPKWGGSTCQHATATYNFTDTLSDAPGILAVISLCWLFLPRTDALFSQTTISRFNHVTNCY
jgi:hypothetical protein